MLDWSEVRLMKRAVRRNWRRFRTLAVIRFRRMFGPAPLGARGEREAAKYLRRQGCRVVASSYRDRLGEVDLVCVKERRLVFVEVKTRRNEDAGLPVEAVNRQKQRRITAAAERFIRRYDLQGVGVQFDVISVVWPHDARRPMIKHYPQAYEALSS